MTKICGGEGPFRLFPTNDASGPSRLHDGSYRRLDGAAAERITDGELANDGVFSVHNSGLSTAELPRSHGQTGRAG